mgnify:FL=1
MNISSEGSFNNLESFLKRAVKNSSKQEAVELAEAIVSRLRQDTPKRSGKTASSWSYNVSNDSNGFVIEIINTNNNGSVNVARIIHFGHGTGTGGYVPPKPFITTAIDSVYKSKIDSILTKMVK